MDDEIAMGIGDRLQNMQKEMAAGFYVESVLTAENIDRATLDKFHGEVRNTFSGCASIEEPGNKGMIEIGQDLPLFAKSAQHLLGIHTSLYDFEGDLTGVFVVVTQREIDRTHASAPDLAHDPIHSQSFAEKHRRIEDSRGYALNRGVDRGFAIAVGYQQRLHLAAKLDVSTAHLLENLIPFFDGKVC